MARGSRQLRCGVGLAWGLASGRALLASHPDGGPSQAVTIDGRIGGSAAEPAARVLRRLLQSPCSGTSAQSPDRKPMNDTDVNLESCVVDDPRLYVIESMGGEHF